jgi:hypothetical protein
MRGEVCLGTPWYKQSGAFQRRAAVNHQLRWPFARGDGDLPLLKPVRSAILASKRPGIWQMSVKHYIDEMSVTGLTADPTILDHAIKNSASYDAVVREKLKKGRSGGKSSANS